MLLDAVGTTTPLASTTLATINAVSDPLAVTAKLVPSGLTTSGTRSSSTWSGAPAVVLLSLAATLPYASRHCAVTVPACQVTFQCTWNGISVVDCVRFDCASEYHGLGT